MTTTRTRTILLTLLALAGCQPPSAATFGADYEAALCDWATECSVFATRTQCRDALAWDSIGRFQYLEEAVAGGRARFDPDAAAACVDEVRTLACDEGTLTRVLFDVGLAAAPASCQDVYVGLVRNYDPCFSSEECAGEDPVCGLPPACADMCCVGACRERGAGLPKIGDPCTGACERGSYCAFDPNTGQSTVCTKSPGAGQDCIMSGFACDEGLDCVYDDQGLTATCLTPLKAGEACGNGRSCADGLRCYTLGGESRCRTAPDEGEACDENNYPACGRVDNTCEAGSCVRLPDAGAACLRYECVPWADCRDEDGDGNGTCRSRAGLGEGCGAASDYVSCLGHLRCGEGDRCVAPDPEPVCELQG